ncbi:MAG: glycogen/starch synthase, partial [Bacteroidales bacterium]|nr:glycogen/starch synthase [Bacteroidales bacterium]
MKVLMFGWEFPPHITGGLGTACFGLTKGLMKHETDILFVVPKAYGDESEEAVRLINASDVLVDVKDPEYKSYWKRITFMAVGSNLIPYVGPEEFRDMVAQDELKKQVDEKSVLSRKFESSGKYGKDL